MIFAFTHKSSRWESNILEFETISDFPKKDYEYRLNEMVNSSQIHIL